MSDVMGLTMVVDYNTNRKPDGAFESSVLEPFYRAGAPWIDIGGDPISGKVFSRSQLTLSQAGP